MYCIRPCCISLFSFQVKPFYTDVFYLHSPWSYLHKLWSYLHKLWSYLQRLAEIEQAGRKPLTIQWERFRDMDKIFSIALLLDESFLNISIKKAVSPKEIQFLYVIPLRFERKTHALEGRCSIQLSYGTILNCECKGTVFIEITKRIRNFFCINNLFFSIQHPSER